MLCHDFFYRLLDNIWPQERAPAGDHDDYRDSGGDHPALRPSCAHLLTADCYARGWPTWISVGCLGCMGLTWALRSCLEDREKVLIQKDAH